MVARVLAQIPKLPPRLPAPPSLRSLPVVTTHHLLPPVFRPPLCFHALTNPSSRKPFIFTSIQIPRGCGGTSLQSPSQLVPLWQIHCFQVFAASFSSLCALFCPPSLGFQSFAASFPKTPGWGVPRPSYRQTVRCSKRPSAIRNVDSARTSNYHCCKLKVPGPWMKPPN